MKKLGFGLSRLPLLDLNDPSSIDMDELEVMIGSFLCSGHFYFDASYVYHGGLSEKVFGQLVADKFPRECFNIGTKVPVSIIKEASDYERIFAEQLERCKVEYFDYYYLQSVGRANYGSENTSAGFEFLKKLKKEGLAMKTGFSYHGKPEFLERILDEHPEIDVVQLVINYVDWEDRSILSRECYDVCQKRGIQVIALEPLKGGALVKLPEDAVAVMKHCNPYASFASWGLRFTASLKNVTIVVNGMSNYEQMKDNIRSLSKLQLMSEEEYAALSQVTKILRLYPPVGCTGCGCCMECCPQNIDIPKLFALYNNQHQFKRVACHDLAYANFTVDRSCASACIRCGKCQEVCPEHLPIIDKLRLVSSAFERKKR